MAEQLKPISNRRAGVLGYVSAFFVYTAMYLLRLLPLDWASALGGKAARIIGPHIAGATRTARNNLNYAFPEKSDHLKKDHRSYFS